TSFETSSPGLPMIATGWPSNTRLPVGTSSLGSVPLSNDRNSIVALSVSTSASRSSMAMGSPSFLCQMVSCPSVIVGDSLGISSSLAISISPVERALDRFDDARGLRDDELLELRVVGHRHVHGLNPFDRRVELVECEPLNAVGNFGTNPSVGPAFA